MLKLKLMASLLSLTMLSTSLLSTTLTLKNNNQNYTSSVAKYITKSTTAMNQANIEIKNLEPQLEALEGPIKRLTRQAQESSLQNYNLEKEHEKLLKELNSLLGKCGSVKLSKLQYNIKNSKYLYNNAPACRIVIYHIISDYFHIPYYKLYGMNSFIRNEFGNNIITTPPTGSSNPWQILDSISQSNILLNPNKTVNKAACFSLIDFILVNDLGYPRDGWGLTTYSVEEVNFCIKQFLNGSFNSIGGIISRIIGHEIFITKPLSITPEFEKENNIIEKTNLIKKSITLKDKNINATNNTVSYFNNSIQTMNSAIVEIKSLCNLIKIDRNKISSLKEEISSLNNQNQKLKISNKNLKNEIDNILGCSNPKLYHILFNLRDSKTLYNNQINSLKIIDYIADKYLHVPKFDNSQIALEVGKQYKDTLFGATPTGNQSADEIIKQITKSKVLLNSNGTVNIKQCYDLINFILEDDLGYQRSGTGFFTYSIQEVDTAIKELANGTFYNPGQTINRIWHDIFVKNKVSKNTNSNIINTNSKVEQQPNNSCQKQEHNNNSKMNPQINTNSTIVQSNNTTSNINKKTNATYKQQQVTEETSPSKKLYKKNNIEKINNNTKENTETINLIIKNKKNNTH